MATSNYKQRLKDIGASWSTEKAHSGGFFKAAPGTYQGVIHKAQTRIAKKGKGTGKLHIDWKIKIVSGDYTGKIVSDSLNLEWMPNSNQSAPSGIARFKGMLKLLGVEAPNVLSEKSLKEALEACLDSVLEFRVVHDGQWVNIYWNRLIDGGGEAAEADDEDLELEEEDLEELEEDEEEDDDEEEDEEDDEEEPLNDDDEFEEDEEEEEEQPVTTRKKKVSKKKASKAATPSKKTSKKKSKKKASTKAADIVDEEDDDGDEW